MEVFRTYCSQASAAPSAEDEKVLTFLREEGASSAWPILYSIWKRRNCTAAGEAASRYFVDNVDNPTCVMELCYLQGDESASTSANSEQSAGDAASTESSSPVDPNQMQYAMISLCTARNASKERIALALDHLAEQLSVPNWNDRLLFQFLDRSLYPEIEARAQLRGGETVPRGHSIVYALQSCSSDCSGSPEYQHPKPSLPEGFSFRDLDSSDAVLINDIWKFGGKTRSLNYIRRCIRTAVPGGAIGICASAPERTLDTSSSHATDENIGNECSRGRETGPLVAWGLVPVYGSIGLLHTIPEYQRRGLARAIIGRFCQTLTSYSLQAFCCIQEYNEASAHCFQQAGFVKQGDSEVQWVMYYPEGCERTGF